MWPKKKRIVKETKRREAVFFRLWKSLESLRAALWDGSRGMMLDADEETLLTHSRERPWWPTAVPSPLRIGTGAVHWRPKASTCLLVNRCKRRSKRALSSKRYCCGLCTMGRRFRAECEPRVHRAAALSNGRCRGGPVVSGRLR